MSDYLGHLAARTLNLVEMVRPRPVSLFEPPPVNDWPISVHPFGLETSEDEPTTAPAAPDVPAPAWPSVERPATSLPPEPRRQRAADSPAIPDQRLVQPTDRLPTAPQSVVMASAPDGRLEIETAQSASSSPASRLSIRPQRAWPSAGQTSQLDGHSMPGASQPLVSPVAAPTASSQTDGRSDVNASRFPFLERPIAPLASAGDGENGPSLPGAAEKRRPPVLEPVVRPIVIQRSILPAAPPPVEIGGAQVEATPSQSAARRASDTQLEPASLRLGPLPFPIAPLPAAARPHAKSRVEPTSPARVELAATPEPAPTIQVTIGRIEVRATPPPPPAPRKQRAGPAVMSLDEYLRQRAEGEPR